MGALGKLARAAFGPIPRRQGPRWPTLAGWQRSGLEASRQAGFRHRWHAPHAIGRIPECRTSGGLGSQGSSVGCHMQPDSLSDVKVGVIEPVCTHGITMV